MPQAAPFCRKRPDIRLPELGAASPAELTHYARLASGGVLRVQSALGGRFIERDDRVSDGPLSRVQVSFFNISSRRLHECSGAGPQWILALVSGLGRSI